MTDVAAPPFAATDYVVPGLYLDSAARHPLPQPVVAVLEEQARFLGAHRTGQELGAKQEAVRGAFAGLIGADIDEVALVPSTVMAENLLLHALDLMRAPRRVVTDALHFAGSLDLYRTLAADGLPVTIVPQDGAGIDHDRLEQALLGDVALVALSSVSHRNGFEHDLATVCALAHAHGALVYADIIQHAGALPLDVRASGVDFCACSSYKWLLGDIGLGFLYVRRDRWPLLRRVLAGPSPRTPSSCPALFQVSPFGGGPLSALLLSLPRVAGFMATAPETVWRPLATRIDARMAAAGLAPLSPRDGRTPIRAFADDRITHDVLARLRRRGVRLTGRDGYLRWSPSVFNTPEQIDDAADAVAEAIAMR